MLQNRVNQKDQANFRSKLRSLTVQFCLILTIALALFIAPVAASHAFAEGDITHIVQPGESLSSIAVRYGVSVNALANYNRIRNINFLRVGQSLQIPGTTMSPAPAQPLYQPPARTLADSRVAQPNGAPGLQTTPTPYIVDPYYPTPTPTLVIPTRIPPVSTTRIHVVAAADTLTGIANLYGTSAWAIKSRNGLTSDRIYRGQRLIIP